MYELNLAFTLALFLAVTALFVASGRASVFHPGAYYLFFHGLVFVVRPLVKYFLDFRFVYGLYRFWPSSEIQNQALLAANLGLVSFMTALMLVGGSKLQFSNKARAALGQARAKSSLLLASLICSPLMGVSIYYGLNRSTDFERTSMLRDFTTMVAINTDTSGYIVEANQMLGPVSVLIAWAYRFRPLALIPFGFFVVFRMYVGWGRWSFVMAAASLALLYFYENKRRWPTLRATAIALALLLVFHAIGQSRSFLRDLLSDRPTAQTSTEDSLRNPLDNMDFANLEYLEYILAVVPERTDTYDYFLRNLQIFTEPIPRVLWPGKPIGPPIQLYNIYQYGFPIGITWTLVGEGWQDLGWAGVVIWCCFAGLLLGALYEWFARSDQSVFKVAIFAVVLPLSVQWFRDGVLVTVFKFPLFFVLPILVWYFIDLVMKRPQRAAWHAQNLLGK